MIKVNLISKRNQKYKGKNWTRVVILSLFGLLLIYFVGITMYVIISISVLNKKISNINNETVKISKEMLTDNDKLNRFILTKLILTKIQEINKGRFLYKEYLDQVSVFIPEGSLLSSVGFTTKGWISVSISSASLRDYETLEKTLLNETLWKESKYFSGAYIENVSKLKAGDYSTRLQLELKK